MPSILDQILKWQKPLKDACPHCGSKAVLISWADLYWAECTNKKCGAETVGEFDPGLAEAHWARRADAK